MFPIKPTDNPQSLVGIQHHKSVSGNNNPLAFDLYPGFTSAGNDLGTPTSTMKHAIVDNNGCLERTDTSKSSDSSKTRDTEDDTGDDGGGQAATEDGT